MKQLDISKSTLSTIYVELANVRCSIEDMFRNEIDKHETGGLEILHSNPPENKSYISDMQPIYQKCIESMWETWNKINRLMYDTNGNAFETLDDFVKNIDEYVKERHHRFTVAEMMSPDFEKKFWDAWEDGSMLQTHFDILISDLMCATFHHTDESAKPIVDEFIKEHPEILRAYDEEHLYKI